MTFEILQKELAHIKEVPQNSCPGTKHEVDQTIHCTEMAILKFPKREVIRHSVINIHTLMSYAPLHYVRKNET